MAAIAKVVFSPPALFGMVQCNSHKDWGKTISMMGMIDFGLEKYFEQMFVPQRFPPFSESRVSIWTVLYWGSLSGNGDLFFFNPRIETGIPHFHMGICQSPFPNGDPCMETFLAAKFFGDAMVPGVWLNGRPKLQSMFPYRDRGSGGKNVIF